MEESKQTRKYVKRSEMDPEKLEKLRKYERDYQNTRNRAK